MFSFKKLYLFQKFYSVFNRKFDLLNKLNRCEIVGC